MKRKLIAAAALALAACTATTPKPNLVEPVTGYISVYNSFNETGRQVLAKYFETPDDIPSAMAFIGTDIPSVEIKGYNTQNFNLSDFSGTNTVIEITAYWCEHCQAQSKNMEIISKEHPEINLIQIFGEGESNDEEEGDQVALFFKDGIPGEIRIGEETKEFNSYAFDELTVDAYPTFLFFDEDGKLSFVFEGTLSEPLFKEMIADVFDTDHALYKNLKEGYGNVFDGVRTWEDVKADIDENAVKRVSALVEGVTNGEEVVYSNMGVKMESSDVFADLYGNEADFGSFTGTTMYCFLDVDTLLGERIDVVNAFKSNHKDVNVVLILLGQEMDDAENFTKETSKRIDGFVFDAFRELPDMLYPVVIYKAPTVVFVDEELKVAAGGYNGEFTEGALQGAFTVLTGNGAPYKSAKGA